MEVTLEEMKKSYDDLRNAFEEHKKTADARLDAVKASKSTADFDEKLARISEAIAKAEGLQAKWRKEQDEVQAKREAEQIEWRANQLETERKLEARINRAALGLGGVLEDGEGKVAKMREAKAYATYLRKGHERLSPDEQKVLVVSSDPTGGYLAPPTYVAEIIKAAVLYSPMRDLVTLRTIGTGGEYQQPKRTQSAAATRMSEIGTRSETQNPAWGMVKIAAPEMYAEARISMANLEDSAFNLEQELSSEFAEQFGVKEGAEIINGTGSGEILGFLSAHAAGPSTPIAFTVSGSAATIAGASGSQADGLINLFHALKSPYALGARWVLNRGSLGKIRLLKDTTGQYLWQVGVQAGAPSTILGAPYTEAPDMPDEGAGTFPIAFGDWKRAFTLVEKIEMSIVRDPYTLASTGQVKFSARRRVGGQVVLGEAIRLLKCST